jgi:hypothetical protein
MSKKEFSSSRVHDLLGAIFGVFALLMLVTSPWQVDTSGPDPFYKGPLIFPMIVFSLIFIGSLPSIRRLIIPQINASWYLDGYGRPVKTVILLGLLCLYISGIITIGLEVSTWVFLTAAMKIVKQDSLGRIILVPFSVTVILFILFKIFLDIWFPEPLIVQILTG